MAVQAFSDFKFVPELEHNLLAFGFSQPTEIQKEVIPCALAGGDLMAAAPTGTGKSAAFLLPIMHQILSKHRRVGDGHIRALIVAPTRELVIQTRDFLLHFSQSLPIRVTTIYGGTGISPQLQELRQGTDIVIATPGRVVDLISRKELIASSIEQFVLDEVDRMVEMGFVHEINDIIKELSENTQMMFFSATVTKAAAIIAGQALRRPTMIDLSGSLVELKIPTSVTCQKLFVEKTRKRKLLQWIIDDSSFTKMLVFVRNRAEAERLEKDCVEHGHACGAIFGEMSNAQRMQVVEKFAHGKLPIIIATDILARGIDVVDLTHVVNYAIPHQTEQFIHRIGRTGRAGKSGVAISLIDQEDRLSWYRLENKLQTPIELVDWHPYHNEKIQEMSYEDSLARSQKSRAPLAEKMEEKKAERRREEVKKSEEAQQAKILNRKKKKKELVAKYGVKLTGKGHHKGLANKTQKRRKK